MQKIAKVCIEFIEKRMLEFRANEYHNTRNIYYILSNRDIAEAYSLILSYSDQIRHAKRFIDDLGSLVDPCYFKTDNVESGLIVQIPDGAVKIVKSHFAAKMFDLHYDWREWTTQRYIGTLFCPMWTNDHHYTARFLLTASGIGKREEPDWVKSASEDPIVQCAQAMYAKRRLFGFQGRALNSADK